MILCNLDNWIANGKTEEPVTVRWRCLTDGGRRYKVFESC